MYYYSYCGNLIIPLVQIVLGQEMVFYASAYMIIQTILLWTHCKFIISEECTFNIRKILCNINIIAILFGIIMFITQIKLPTSIQSSMNSMGNLIGPLSMFVVGMLLADMDLRKVFSQKRVYLISFFRLIKLPVIILIIFIFTGMINIMEGAQGILLVSLLAACAPSASTVTQFAQIYDNNSGQASVINALSVTLCIMTMPFITMIYNILAVL